MNPRQTQSFKQVYGYRNFGFLRDLLAVFAVSAIAFGLFSAPAAADPPQNGAPEPSLTLQGFGTLGVAQSDDDSSQFVRDLAQPRGLENGWSGKIDSQLGLQANIGLSEQTEGVLQVVSRYRYDGSYRPELTWAYVHHNFTPDACVRVGRLGTEFFMLADTRMVGYSNLTVRPSSDYFGSLIFSYIDGIDANLTTPIGNGLLRSKLFAGLSPEKSPFVEGLDWDLNGSLLLGGYLDYLNGDWQTRLSHAQVRFENETPIDTWVKQMNPLLPSYLALVPEMGMKDTWSSFTSLGLVYDKGPLQLQWMLNQIRHESSAYEDSRAGYFIAAYRLGDVTPYAGFSRVLSSRKSTPSSMVPGVDGLTTLLQAESHSDQRTWSLGGRWDIRRNLALKAQVDWIRGNTASTLPFRGDGPTPWDGDMTVYSLALDFVF